MGSQCFFNASAIVVGVVASSSLSVSIAPMLFVEPGIRRANLVISCCLCVVVHLGPDGRRSVALVAVRRLAAGELNPWCDFVAHASWGVCAHPGRPLVSVSL